MNRGITIFLATYNGEQFLREQIESIKNQSYSNWRLVVSDDGSSDNTIKILKSYQSELGEDKVIINRIGPNVGHCKNFLFLVCDESNHTEYYAYCDQDDIWLPNKIEHAITCLNTVSPETPAMYCSRTQNIDEHGRMLYCSKLFKRAPDFKNALVQSIAGGNTMVLNQAAINLIRKAGVVNVVAHDWWTYLLISGCGGKVFYDHNPSVLYRQHNHNQIGANSSLSAQFHRAHLMFKGQFRHYNNLNIAALKENLHMLTEDNRKLVQLFFEFRNQGLMNRLSGLIKSGIYRQTIFENIGLFLATIFKKL